MSLRVRYVILAFAIGFVSFRNGFSQIQERVAAEARDKATNLALGVCEARDEIPRKWAAKQVRVLIEHRDIAQGKLYETRYIEFAARDEIKGIGLSRLSRDSSTQFIAGANNSIPMDVFVYESAQKKMFKRQDEDWTGFTVLPNFGYPRTDPFSWCLGCINSSAAGSITKNYLREIQFHPGGECIEAIQTKRGMLGTFGAKETNQITSLLTVLYDSVSGMPIEYEFHLCPKGWSQSNPKKYPRDSVERGVVKWNKYKVRDFSGKSSSREFFAPIRVEILSTMNEGSELECTNDIHWLFDDEVPDSVFVDPTQSKVVEPDFSKSSGMPIGK